MREIKFRAWDKNKERMLFNVERCNNFNLPVWHDNFHTMQYTGLKDKNGRDIYEGDIVSTEGERFIIKFSTSYNHAYYAGYSAKNESLETATELFDYSSLEVIGNIYQNKELLNA